MNKMFGKYAVIILHKYVTTILVKEKSFFILSFCIFRQNLVLCWVFIYQQFSISLV